MTALPFTVTLERPVGHPDIAVIVVDNPPVNAMGIGVPGAVIRRIAEANADHGVASILLMAAGKGGFAGADIRMQGKPWQPGEPRLTDLIVAIEASRKPIAILLQQHALGGGLEIALACRMRIATPGTRLGQPEVKLGIPPGAGGTQRLPRVVGAAKALDMIVTGAPITAEDGAAHGLVDLVVPAATAIAAALQSVSGKVAAADLPAPVRERPVAGATASLFDDIRARLEKSHRGQRAPQVCVDCVEAAARLALDDGVAYERARFEECVKSDEAAGLRHVFFAETAARKLPVKVASSALRPIRQTAVIGAGTMGGGIAMALANGGYPVTLVEREAVPLDNGIARIKATYQGQAARGKLSGAEAAARIELIRPAVGLGAVADADLVIEAVFEEMAVKSAVFSELARLAKPGAILATNTSYLDVDEIAGATSGREADVLGLHFFSPANIMPLLEIVRAARTADDVLATAMELGKRLGKTAIVAGVCHGFIANRSLTPYLREAEFLLEEGATPQEVDKALTDFGMAMGPFAVRDLAGLDIGWAMRKATAHERDPAKRYSRIGDVICERGWFGQKSGRGFYRYQPGSRTPVADPEVEEIIRRCAREAGFEARPQQPGDIVARCLLAVVNEGARELAEGIAQRASDFDLAWINGFGFPRWRGGPLHWASRSGLDKVAGTIGGYSLSNDYWEVAPLLRQLADTGKTFADWDSEKVR